jgi:arylsulfatase A-like enzyme
MCQHKAPHRDWEPALRHLGHDHDQRYPEPPTLFDDYAGRGKAEHSQDMTIASTMDDKDLKLVSPAELTPAQRVAWNAYYEPRNAAFRKAGLQGKDLVRWKYNRYLHDYLGCIKAVDESVGRLLAFLDDKRWIFEESLRTPLLIRWPGVVKAGSSTDRIVSNLDFAETFLDAAGLPIPAEMQGRSLVPLLEGRIPADWRRSLYYHYYEYPGPHNVRRHYGVVTDRYKLVHFYEPDINYWELFDLASDPRELQSVYGQPDHARVQQELERELARLRKDLNVPFPDPPQSMIKEQRKTPGK